MNYKITPEILRQIAGAPVSKSVVDGIVEHLPEVIAKYNINTDLRLAHFLAQLAHESDHFRTYEEYASGSAYEGRRDLGNIKRGDGRKYKGRGPIQITGRYNYRKYGNLLGINLEENPNLAETHKIGLMIAGEYWHQNGLNSLADKDNGKQITRKINGGYNGLQDRLNKVARAKKAIAHAHTDAPVVAVKIEDHYIEDVKKPDPTPVPVVPEPVVETPVVVEVSVPDTLPLFAQAPEEDKGMDPPAGPVFLNYTGG